MPKLTIDGREVSVEEGTTVLEAAEQAGIRIPKLCHMAGLEPATSCFLCAVRVEGRRGFVPSCALPAVEGMVVTSNSDDVRKGRKLALELLLSDHAGECVAPCAAACPAGLDIPGFIREIAVGDVWRARETISRRLALPGVLGRICPKLCERQCRRGEYDQGLGIGRLHRYVADQDGCGRWPTLLQHCSASGKAVAVVGGGPAGLSAAFCLRQSGHSVTVFDARERAGGMLRYAIPAYRLPREVLDVEIAGIEQIGARFEMGRRWGADFTLGDLRKAYDAVFLGTGAQRSQGLGCEGEELAVPALEFLRQLAGGVAPVLGDDAVVIGGGNTALDCARAAVRLKARGVRILYRRTRREMPCLLSEVEEAQAEGVEIRFLVTPVRIRCMGHHRYSLTCRHMELGEPDASGRRRPTPVEGSEFELSCSTVIAAIGQRVETEVAEREGLALTRWGIAADMRTMATNLEGVFAGGDAVLGADLAVRAVAGGRIAASSIDQYLRGEVVRGVPAPVSVTMRPMDDGERAAMFRGLERAPRVPMPTITFARRRSSFQEVEGGWTRQNAEREARRCLRCGCSKAESCRLRELATEYGSDPSRFAGARRRFARDLTHPEITYEPGKCVMCQACVRIAAEEEDLGMALVGRGFDVAVAPPFGMTVKEGLRQTARRCAEACPTGALALRPSGECGNWTTSPSGEPGQRSRV